MLSLGLFLGLASAVPQFAQTSYYLRGEVSLPYADIVEPFEVWTDLTSIKAPRQRVEHYSGESVYYFQPRLNASFQIVPAISKRVCLGGFSQQVELQDFLPVITSEYRLSESTHVIRGISCFKYVRKTSTLNKQASYNFYVDAQHGDPVRFEFRGYDELLGSHFDEYVFDYFVYSESQRLVSDKDFDNLDRVIQSDFCKETEFSSGPSFSGSFFSFGDDDVHVSLRTKYADHISKFEEEHSEEGMLNFMHNSRMIHAHNRKASSFKMGLNRYVTKKYSGLSYLRPLKGKLIPNAASSTFSSSGSDLPNSFDWRPLGAVSPVKDQGICGSCWSFGSSEAVEGQLFVATGKLVRLSAQALVDCSWEFGNMGCGGGFDFQAYNWIIQNGGIPTEESYPYRMTNGYCKVNEAKTGATISSYVNVTSGDIKALKQALIRYGPISVSIDASPQGFGFYTSGVFYDPKCGNKLNDLDHSVLLVGYGVENGEEYWIIKNSWSPYWGDQGYIKIATRDNNCGVATAPTFVNIVPLS